MSQPRIQRSPASASTSKPLATLPTAAPVQVAAAGDIASVFGGDSQTARLLQQPEFSRMDVLALGDTCYEIGHGLEYRLHWGPTWGRFNDRVHPTVGNHEYLTGEGSGYASYFSGRVDSPAPGAQGKFWYAFDLSPKWRAIALNSVIGDPNRGGTDSPLFEEQKQFLTDELKQAREQGKNTLLYWHHPLLSSGNNHGSPDGLSQEGEWVKPLFQLGYDLGADVVLSGHEHWYERFAPVSPEGTADPAGIRTFVVGTGGRMLEKGGDDGVIPGGPHPASEVRTNDAFGVLKLNLEDDRFGWEFRTVDGETLDKGTQPVRP